MTCAFSLFTCWCSLQFVVESVISSFFCLTGKVKSENWTILDFVNKILEQVLLTNLTSTKMMTEIILFTQHSERLHCWSNLITTIRFRFCRQSHQFFVIKLKWRRERISLLYRMLKGDLQRKIKALRFFRI